MLARRTVLASGAALAATSALARETRPRGKFPKGFLWGAATAGHQVEGNNTNSDCWFMENVKPTTFSQKSGDAANSFMLWRKDLELIRNLGLNTYRFSLEWARIEPEQGLWSVAMLDHYKTMIETCRQQGITPIVTFNHFTTPRWFAVDGGWTNPQAPARFAKFCERAAQHLAGDIGYATTLNEPNLFNVLRTMLPPAMMNLHRPMLEAAAKASNSPKFSSGNAMLPEDFDLVTSNLVAGHKAGRDAIKSVRPSLPVGVSLAMPFDEAVGANSLRDAMRRQMFQPWLDAVRGDDFLGVQNYERQIWDDTHRLPPTPGAPVNYAGSEVYPPSLAGVARYAHEATGLPILVTEHGVGTNDDTIRADFIPKALEALNGAITDGVPVIGYCHWSLIDNFEWIFGYRVRFGLHTVDPVTFVRTPKPSAKVYAAFVKQSRS